MNQIFSLTNLTPKTPTYAKSAFDRVFKKSSSHQNQVQQQLPVQAPPPTQLDVQANQSRKRKQPFPHVTARPHTSSRKRKKSPIPKYDDTEFTMNKTNIFTRLMSKIKSCRIFLNYKEVDQQQLDSILLRFIFDNLPRGIDSSLAFLKVDFGMDQLAAYICQKIYAQSVNYPGSGLEAAFTNQTLIDIILNKNTVIFPNHNMVKKCVNTLSDPVFECTLDSIQLSGLRDGLIGANLFVSARCDIERGESPFPCYFVGNYLYSIGPMIIDPDGSHIGRTLIMIHVLNYKNHIYPCGIYFWVYPSSSEGGLNRIFFKLPGGVTGATYIKGTDYFSQSEIAALESIINEFSETAQANPAGPTIISDYDTFICFLGNMPYLQIKDISSMLPTISSGVPNRYCYKINMATRIGIDLFTCDNPAVLSPEEQQQEKRNKSILFFRHIFDYGFDDNYQRNSRSFRPIRPINFDTVCASLKAKIGDDVDVKFPWIHTLKQYKLQPVCSFSCIHLANGIVRFEDLLTMWQGTQTVQGVEIYHPPHPNVCTVTGSLAYVVGHRGNSFLPNMVPAIVKSFLPHLPVERLSTYSRDEKMLFMASSETRRGRQFTDLNSPIMDRQVLQGDHGIILPTRIRSIVKKIASFFRMPQAEKAKLDKKIRDKLKICLFAFLEIPMSEESNQNFITQTELFLRERVEKAIGLKNVNSILDAATYSSMIAADMKRVYLGIDPIKDAAPPKKILVQVSWLGKNHNYVPIGPETTSFDYDDDNSAAQISSIFTDPNFSPYIMQAQRDAKTFTEKDLLTMTLNRGAAARSIYSDDIRMRKLPVKVFNKTMLFRVIVYNDVNNNPENDGPESVKFGALEVIVSVSSTAVLTKKIKELKFGTDVQFCVVSITACHHIRGSDGVDYFQKFQTFHGTNADIEAIGMWGTIKIGDYAATIIGNDQFHPELSEALRNLMTMDDNYVNTSVSPYNTADHWIMKLFAPVLRRGDDEQTLRNEIFKKWEWENTIANFYGIPLTTPVAQIVSEMTTQIQQMGNVIRWAAYIFFSEHEVNPEQADEHTSDAERSSRSSSRSSSNRSSRSSSRSSSNRSSSSKESTGKRLRRFLLVDPLAPQAPPGSETPKSYKSRKLIVNSSDEGSPDDEGKALNWGDLDTPKSKKRLDSNNSTGTASPTGIGGTRRRHIRVKRYHSLATRKRKYVRSKYSLKNKKNINKNVNKHNKNKNIKTKTKIKRVKSYQLRLR